MVATACIAAIGVMIAISGQAAMVAIVVIVGCVTLAFIAAVVAIHVLSAGRCDACYSCYEFAIAAVVDRHRCYWPWRCPCLCGCIAHLCGYGGYCCYGRSDRHCCYGRSCCVGGGGWSGLLLSVVLLRSLLWLIPFFASGPPLVKWHLFLLMPRSLLLTWSRVVIWSLWSLLTRWSDVASVTDKG